MGGGLAAFLGVGTSVSVASVTAGGRPVVGRGLGWRVEADGRTVTVFLDDAANEELVDALAASSLVAVVLSQPTTHRSIQVKGHDARVAPAPAEAAALVDHHIAGFARELAAIGYGEVFTRALCAFEAADLVAVSFTPDAGFDQTPGPRAGEPLPQ